MSRPTLPQLRALLRTLKGPLPNERHLADETLMSLAADEADHDEAADRHLDHCPACARRFLSIVDGGDQDLAELFQEIAELLTAPLLADRRRGLQAFSELGRQAAHPLLLMLVRKALEVEQEEEALLEASDALHAIRLAMRASDEAVFDVALGDADELVNLQADVEGRIQAQVDQALEELARKLSHCFAKLDDGEDLSEEGGGPALRWRLVVAGSEVSISFSCRSQEDFGRRVVISQQISRWISDPLEQSEESDAVLECRVAFLRAEVTGVSKFGCVIERDGPAA